MSATTINFVATLDCSHTFYSMSKLFTGDIVPCLRCARHGYSAVVEVAYRDRRAYNRTPNRWER